ncbi:thioesterase II family protein [Streptomyces soliscabiei]|uniref:thioesterase II family protein n=1 Tax=Streptomyces soliscabiei TaxID=588897 RepID=UPI0029AB1590|nr:alpha/beta fold hydrolase [Streptomyces sp. NY05-11A]MDX2679228.1 alpha/beta fold hydrolase [Streptomyces sp. NY05-11A]
MTPITSPVHARAESWGVRWRRSPQARLRLFCLPHAGGGAAAFRHWAAHLSPGIEVVAIRLPGRETRFREEPHHRLDRLVSALVRDIEPLLDRPHAWFGHSMGAGIAFEACRAMRRLGMPEPRRLLVAASPAPHLPRRETPVHQAPDHDLVARLGELNGTSAELFKDKAVLAALLPMLRADFSVAETHRYRPEAPLTCPISAYGGTDDATTTPGDLQEWDRHTTADATVRAFSGGHFFLHESANRFLDVLTADLLLGRAALTEHH